MKTTFTLALLAAGVLPTASVQAQARFSFGSSVGFNLTTAAFQRHGHTFHPTYRTGWEVGLQGTLHCGHFALQPALLYAQKGFGLDESYGSGFPFTSPTVINERYRLNYLTVPLNLAYALRQDGQGPQIFGGPYVGLLVGGHYAVNNRYAMFPWGYSPDQREGKVVARATHTTTYGPAFVDSHDFYSQPWDAGLQAGVGYRLGGALLQLSYSLGLRKLGTKEVYDYGTTVGTYDGPLHRNRGFHASFTYSMGPKS